MEIADIKARLSIETVLDHYQIAVKNKQALCPFHDDKNPSMRIYPETNTYHCFGCGKTGDVIQFIEDKENCSKHEAINKAKELSPPKSSPKGRTLKELSTGATHCFGGDLEGAFTKMKKNLYRSKKATAYLQDRGLSDVILEQGFNGRQFSKLQNCVIYPLKNISGDIVSFYGRSINTKPDYKGSAHYYLAGRSGLYPRYPVVSTCKLIITESIIDAVTLEKYIPLTPEGGTAVLALYGVNGFTDEHKEAIKQWSLTSPLGTTLQGNGRDGAQAKEGKEIILFFDGDIPGQEAVVKYTKQFSEDFKHVKVSSVETPDDEDINTLIRGHEPEILTYLIENREQLYVPIKPKLPTPKVLLQGVLNIENAEYITYIGDLLDVSVLGGISLQNLDKLKVTIRVNKKNSKSPLTTIRQSNLDLYNDDALLKFIRKVAERLELGTKEVQHTLYAFIEELENYRLQQIDVNTPEPTKKRVLSESERRAALNFLKAPNLLERTNELIGKTGLIGEEDNRLLMYLVFTSRLREQPLHIISLGASGTGKTYLQEKISAVIPEDQKLEITALSENALYYFDRTELKNKLVLIEDLDGAQDDKILYAIRELMSKKKISKTIPIKDAKGNLKTVTLQVEGPITLAGTTTKEKIYEDNANRSILIYLDNSEKQKQAIIEYQQKLSAGLIDKGEENKAVQLLQNIQSMLAPVKVRNPYATKLQVPQTVFKPLRTNAHYLAFIETVTFYCQWQKQKKQDPVTGEYFIETGIEEIVQANRLIKDVLLAKSDELTKGCRDFFERVKAHLAKENRATFYSGEIRKSFRMSPSNVKYYLAVLSKYNLIKVIGGNPRRQGYEYEIVSVEEYENLKEGLCALDQVLENLKTAVSG